LHDLFQALVLRVRRPEYRGCAFVNAAAEFPEEDSCARTVALAHKEEMRKRLHGLCRNIGAARPKALANQLLMLIDGVYTTAGILGKRDAVKASADAAEALIEAAVR
jgi:hypothetical protein